MPVLSIKYQVRGPSRRKKTKTKLVVRDIDIDLPDNYKIAAEYARKNLRAEKILCVKIKKSGIILPAPVDPSPPNEE
jgi:hypothetical protein